MLVASWEIDKIDPPKKRIIDSCKSLIYLPKSSLQRTILEK